MDSEPHEMEIDEIILRCKMRSPYTPKIRRGLAEGKDASSESGTRISISIGVTAVGRVHACYRASGDCGILFTWEK